MSTTLKLFGDRILVLQDPEEEVSDGGIIIPDTATKERPQMGTVVSVGPGRWDERRNQERRMQVKPGDRVLYGKYSGTDIELDGEAYVITTEGDIFGIVKESGGE